MGDIYSQTAQHNLKGSTNFHYRIPIILRKNICGLEINQCRGDGWIRK